MRSNNFQHVYINIYYDLQSLVIPEKFQHILRVMNTNIDGRRKVPFAMTSIKVCYQNLEAFQKFDLI